MIPDKILYLFRQEETLNIRDASSLNQVKRSMQVLDGLLILPYKEGRQMLILLLGLVY